MSDKEQQIWRAKRLIGLASKATLHASRRIRAGLPAAVALQRSHRLVRLSSQAFAKATA